jgi:DNA-binding MarR family transcriptional regulator
MITLHQRLMRSTMQEAKVCLSPLQMHMLQTIRENGPVAMTMLAAEVQIAKQQMTRMVNNFVVQGIIQRSFDESDRRVIMIGLTVAGLELLDTIDKEVQTVLAAKLASFNANDVAELDDTVSRLTRILKQLP